MPELAPAARSDVPPRPVGLAAKVCPIGPFPVPLSGELSATALASTAPTDLDPTDTAFHLYEGAVWLDGALYFSDFKTTPGFPSRILRYRPSGGLELALADSGTNGLGLDAQGLSLVGARHKSKSIVRFSSDLSALTELATGFGGRPFNSPNDVATRSDGTFYFTDPDFQAGSVPTQSTTNVYRVSSAGVVSLVDDAIKNPNGVTLSLDERALFVAGNLEDGFVKRYPLDAEGNAAAGTVFVAGISVPDGMTVDCAGNLYVTEHIGRRVRVFDPAGRELGQIVGFEQNVTNVAFGGAERRTLFITLTGALAQVELPLPGLPY